MAKVAVIGRSEEILCYMAAGFEMYTASDDTEAESALQKAADDGCAVVFLGPEFSHIAEEHEAEYSERLLPALVPLPSKEHDTGTSLLKRYVERAVGSDIVFGDSDR